MKKTNIYQLTLGLFMFIGLIGCSDDFFDVNDNPNYPSYSSPSLTLPVAQVDLTDMNATYMNYLGQFMVYNWGVPSNWGAQENLLRYNFTNNSFSDIFNESYANVFKNLTYIEQFEDSDGIKDYTIYQGISKILKAFQYQYLVDLYGDVPYTEANLRIENTTPAYDDAEFVYKANIDALTEAVLTLEDFPINAENPTDQDVIFNGDIDSWQKFANTIKLRYLVRMSDNSAYASYIAEEIQKIQENGKGFITENVMVNPGYSDNEDKQNPFFGYIGNKPGTDNATNRNEYTIATDYTINFLDFNNDPRLTRLYSEAENGGYHGAPQDTDLPGTGYTTDDLSTVGPGLIKSSDQDQPLMLLSEALFLQAEAKLSGILPGGEAEAKQDYENAILSSFEFLEVEDYNTAFTDYISNGGNNINWDSSSSKLEAIITQKWIALNGTSGIEMWIEKTRTGFPSGIPLSNSAETNERPIRLLYPSEEIARNSDNVPDQSKNDVFTDKQFWNK